MNFSISGGGLGIIGGFVLFGALMLACVVIVALVVRAVRGRDDARGDGSDRRAPEDDYML